MALPAAPADDIALNDLLQEWDAIQEAETMLRERRRRWELAAGSALADVDYDPRQGYDFGGRDTVWHYQPRSDKWNGEGVLDDICRDLIDPATGEQTTGLTRDVLDQVLPAVTGGATSSKWKTTALPKRVVDRRRSSDWKDPVVKLGRKP